MPGDYDIEYASPWAGANFMPVGSEGSKLRAFEKATWPELDRICGEVPEAGIHYQECKVYGRKKDEGTAVGIWFQELMKEDPWFKDLMPEFRILDKSELPPSCETGTSFKSICINTAIYLPWLLGQCLKNNVVIKRGIIDHISEAPTHHTAGTASIIINCTGLMACKLGGVMDSAVYPGRGQIAIVRNEPGAMHTTSGTDDGPDEAMYIMQRAAGGGTIIGGCLQHGNWDSQVDSNLANRILQRAVDICPSLVPKTGKVTELSVVRHGVGLRPMREGGIRVEKEPTKHGWLLHNYGHAGYGYQSSFGSAFATEKMVLDILSKDGLKAKL